jgi:uncharacterized protein YbcI
MLTSANREQAPPAASPLLEIANVMVHLYKEAFGRGPSKARAQFAGSDTLVVLLEDMMTIAERQLLALGEDARVREQRLFLQLALEDKKRSEVERVLRRRAIACVSGTDPDHDLAAEVFLLEPHPAVRSVVGQSSDASRVGAGNSAADPGPQPATAPRS